MSSANARRLLYPLVAATFFGFDAIVWFNEGSFRPADFVASAAIAGMTTVSAWHSFVGSTGVVLVSCLVIASPHALFDSLFAPFLVIIAIAEQISRCRIATATASACLLVAAYWLDPTVRSGWALTMAIVFQLLIALPLGMAMRLHDGQVDALEREAAEIAQRSRTQLALALHDTAITDLTRAIVITRTLLSRANIPDTSELEMLEESLGTALRNLRQTVKLVESSAEDDTSSVHELIHEMASRLTIRNLTLDSSGIDDVTLNRLLGDTGYRFVQLFLREALINCLKYADEGTTIVVLEDEHDSDIEFFVRSVADKGSPGQHDEVYSSGLGIAGLRARAQALGGDVTVGKIPGYWMISLILPLNRVSGRRR